MLLHALKHGRVPTGFDPGVRFEFHSGRFLVCLISAVESVALVCHIAPAAPIALHTSLRSFWSNSAGRS
jgi:hypothetical protein